MTDATDDGPITVDDLIAACREQADRIEAMQRHLVEEGALSRPVPGKVRSRRIFDAIANLLEEHRPTADDVARAAGRGRAPATAR